MRRQTGVGGHTEDEETEDEGTEVGGQTEGEETEVGGQTRMRKGQR